MGCHWSALPRSGGVIGPVSIVLIEADMRRPLIANSIDVLR